MNNNQDPITELYFTTRRRLLNKPYCVKPHERRLNPHPYHTLMGTVRIYGGRTGQGRAGRKYDRCDEISRPKNQREPPESILHISVESQVQQKSNLPWLGMVCGPSIQPTYNIEEGNLLNIRRQASPHTINPCCDHILGSDAACMHIHS